jgi:putrescine aminotransferase
MVSAETLRWQDLDRRHHLHPFTEPGALAEQPVRVITRAQGCHIVDSEGRRLLDGMAGLWCVNVGYGRPELTEAARRQMETLPYYNTFFHSVTPPTVELAARLAGLAPAGLSRVFFTNSGSEANDTVVKLIRYYWNLQGQPRRKIIISRRYAYHGVTLAAASLSGLAPMHSQADLPLPGFQHVMAPYTYQDAGEMSAEAFGLHAARDLERRIESLGPERVAAFIGEPVQGAGGVIIPPATYWPEIQRICRKYDILLVADEVITGFGRTGAWFGSDRFKIAPDLMTIAKGLSSGYQPIAGVLVGPRVAGALVAAGEEWTHGFTYSGHPVAAAVALANLRVMEDERLYERAAGPVGARFAARLAELAELPIVGEVRTLGLIAGIELVADTSTRRPFPPERAVGRTCREHAIRHGLIMRAVRDIMVLAPPLVIDDEELDELASKARLAIEQTARDVMEDG